MLARTRVEVHKGGQSWSIVVFDDGLAYCGVVCTFTLHFARLDPAAPTAEHIVTACRYAADVASKPYREQPCTLVHP